ncbi:MAG: ATP-binding cassette domain-containing protein [Microthrixaceae bacterium]
MSALLELGAGFHPELSGRDNVYLNAAILGMTRREIAARFDDIVEFSGLENFIDSPVKTYSSGMYVRLAFAVAINVDPQLLIIDEILAVGDVTFQQQCIEKFVEFRNEGRTIVLVTHAMNSVRDMCDRAVWLSHGVVVGEGDPAELVEQYTEQMLGHMSRTADGSIRRGSGEVQVERDRDVRQRTSPTRQAVPHRRRRPHPAALPGGQSDPAAGDRHRDRAARRRDRHGAVHPRRRPGPRPDRGRRVCRHRAGSVPLLPGTYDLHTSITDFNRSHVYDHLQVALRFDVMTGKPYESGGLMTLRPEWSIS